MNNFTIGIIIVGIFATLGFSIVIAKRLGDVIKELRNIYHRVDDYCETNGYMNNADHAKMIDRLNEMLDKIPNTFEYNGNKGRIYRK